MAIVSGIQTEGGGQDRSEQRFEPQRAIYAIAIDAAGKKTVSRPALVVVKGNFWTPTSVVSPHG